MPSARRRAGCGTGRIRSRAYSRSAARSGLRGAASRSVRAVRMAASVARPSCGRRVASAMPAKRRSVWRTCAWASMPRAPVRTRFTITSMRSGSTCSTRSPWPRSSRDSPTGSARPTATTRSAAEIAANVAALRRGANWSLVSSSSRSRLNPVSITTYSTRAPMARIAAVTRSCASSGQRLGPTSPVNTSNEALGAEYRCAMRSSSARSSASPPARRQADARPGASSSSPSAGAIAPPYGSASTRATECPAAAISAARLTASVVRPGAPAGPHTAMTAAARRALGSRSPSRDGTGTPPRTSASIAVQCADRSSTSWSPSCAACARSASAAARAISRMPRSSHPARSSPLNVARPAPTSTTSGARTSRLSSTSRHPTRRATIVWPCSTASASRRSSVAGSRARASRTISLRSPEPARGRSRRPP